MKTLPAAVTNLKNQLAVSGAWLTLMDIVDSSTVKHRYVNDTYELVYPTDGNTYSAASFQIQQITEEVQMSLPKITITIYDPELNLKDELQDNAGMSGWTIVLRRVYKATTATGAVTDVGIRQEFTVLDVTMADTVVSLSIGIADPLGRRFPRDNYGALSCRHKYKGGFCRYVASLTPDENGDDVDLPTCTHTLEDAPDGTLGCRAHNNSNQFGGSPGAAEGIFYDR